MFTPPPLACQPHSGGPQTPSKDTWVQREKGLGSCVSCVSCGGRVSTPCVSRPMALARGHLVVGGRGMARDSEACLTLLLRAGCSPLAWPGLGKTPGLTLHPPFPLSIDPGHCRACHWLFAESPLNPSTSLSLSLSLSFPPCLRPNHWRLWESSLCSPNPSDPFPMR